MVYGKIKPLRRSTVLVAVLGDRAARNGYDPVFRLLQRPGGGRAMVLAYVMEERRMKRMTWMVAALVVLLGRMVQAHAGNTTFSVSWSGGSGSAHFIPPLAVVCSTANTLALDPAVLNAVIVASGYQFTELGASSNNPGDSSGALVRLTGTALLNGIVAPPSALTVE